MLQNLALVMTSFAAARTSVSGKLAAFYQVGPEASVAKQACMCAGSQWAVGDQSWGEVVHDRVRPARLAAQATS